mmetsp:Transcript_30326/g.63364  ORF Transcript_30326/g.63364 Transcript_30326/m.63364 type:complete len:379 (-) Transcript_30326:274-1410(-)
MLPWGGGEREKEKKKRDGSPLPPRVGKKNTRMSTTCNRAPSRKRAPSRRRKQEKMSDQDLFMEEDQDLLLVIEKDPCSGKSCNCLYMLRDSALRGAVSLYRVGIKKKSKEDVDQLMIEWYRYAKAYPDKRDKLWYFLPYDATNLLATGVDPSPLYDAKVCSDALHALMRVGTTRKSAILRSYNTTGVAKSHGNKGKSTAIKEDDPRMGPIREHFNELLKLGEDRPTRLISAKVDGTMQRVTRDNEDDSVYLPKSDGFRPCYYRYMSDCGYKCEPQNNGTVTVMPIEGDNQLPHVVLQTYYNIWQRDYPKLKVSKLAEDICDLCTKFANRHAFLANHKTFSSGDANINCEEDADLFIIIEEIKLESKLDDDEERDGNKK